MFVDEMCANSRMFITIGVLGCSVMFNCALMPCSACRPNIKLTTESAIYLVYHKPCLALVGDGNGAITFVTPLGIKVRLQNIA